MRTGQPRIAALAWAAMASVVIAARPAAGAPPAKVLAARAAEYVAHYEEAFSSVLADETTEQRVQTATGQVLATRQTVGEFFTAYVPAMRHWVAVHDIAEVDGTPVSDREELQDLLRRTSLDDAARMLLARNARFNIGSIVRNFNEPLLPLLVFNRDFIGTFSFGRAGNGTRVEDPAQATLTFREHGPGTIIHTTAGRGAPMTGLVVIATETGAIQSSRITVHQGPLTADLETRFALNAHLDLQVPVSFTERYTLGRSGTREVTTCETRLTNYRRFETSGRLIR